MGGGTNETLKEALRRIETLETQKATEQTAGIVRISTLSDVTDSTGMALAASEKNAAVKGSLANLIETKLDGLAEWEDLSSSFYADSGRNTKYEYMWLYYNRALKVAVISHKAGVTGNARTWTNGEIIYKNSRLKSYDKRVLTNGFIIGSSGRNETYELNIVKGDGYYSLQGLNSQGGTFTEAEFSCFLLNAVID